MPTIAWPALSNLLLWGGVLALVLAPLATELPEKFNSLIWVRQNKDTLAMGNITGAMVFQSCIPTAIGIILASAFPAIIVYAQELVPGRIGAVSGLFFGFAFGLGGIAAALLGVVADWRGIEFVYRVCAFLPALGLVTVMLPEEAGS